MSRRKNRLKKRYLPLFLQRHQWMVNITGAALLVTFPVSFPLIALVILWDELKEGLFSLLNDAWDMLTYKWEE